MSLDGHWLEKPRQLLFFLLQSKKPHSVIALFPAQSPAVGAGSKTERRERGVSFRVKVMEGGVKEKRGGGELKIKEEHAHQPAQLVQ